MTKQIVAIGDTGGQLVSKLANNFDELYLGAGGIGYIIQPTDNIDTDAWWNTMIATYSTFSIINDFDFGGATVTLPAGVILLFNGGVWSNGIIVGTNSIFSVYGLQQCFETDLTLTGKWLVDYITPQYYGAITNVNTGIFANDCTAIIQKCVDSLFSVYIPQGFYYIATSIITTQPVTIFSNPTTVEYADSTFSTADHSHIYTNQDIDLFVLRSTGFKLIGGVLDVIQAATYSHSAIMYDLNYSIDESYINCKIWGSKTKLIAGTNTGRGIYANLDTISAVNSGHSYRAKIDAEVCYMKIGVYIPPTNPPYLNTMSIYKIDGLFVGNKQDLILQKGELATITGNYQGDHVCNLLESQLYTILVEIENSTFDVQMADYGEFVGGLYSPLWLYNGGEDNTFIGKSIHSFRNYFMYYPPIVNTQILNPTDYFIINLNRSDRDAKRSLISHIDNQFAYLLKRVSGSKAVIYDGTGYDFDTNLDDSAGLCPPGVNLTSSIALSNLFEIRGQPGQLKFTAPGATLDTDFLEIVIPWNTDDEWFHELTNLEYFIQENGCQFQRIQTIRKYDDGINPPWDEINNNYPILEGAPSIVPARRYVVSDQYSLITSSLKKIIIRFIGGSSVCGANDYMIIHDILCKGQYNTFLPILDVGGGQTIYGELTQSGTDNYHIQTDGVDTFRTGIRAAAWKLDKIIGPLGFGGVEGVDWENIRSET